MLTSFPGTTMIFRGEFPAEMFLHFRAGERGGLDLRGGEVLLDVDAGRAACR